jgi:hypothetical protein
MASIHQKLGASHQNQRVANETRRRHALASFAHTEGGASSGLSQRQAARSPQAANPCRCSWILTSARTGRANALSRLIERTPLSHSRPIGRAQERPAPKILDSTVAADSRALPPGCQSRQRREFRDGWSRRVEAISAAARLALREVRHRIVKSPRSWVAAAGKDAPSTSARDPALLFRGSAREAASRYPLNANVTVVTALSGIGLDAPARAPAESTS